MFSNYNCMGGFISSYWFIKLLFIKLNWGTFLCHIFCHIVTLCHIFMCHIFYFKDDDKGKMKIWVREWLIYIFHTHMKYIQWAPNFIWQSLNRKLASLSSKRLSHSSPSHSDYLLLCSHGTDCLGLSLAIKWMCLTWNASRPFPCSFSGFCMCMLCLPAMAWHKGSPWHPFIHKKQ